MIKRRLSTVELQTPLLEDGQQEPKVSWVGGSVIVLANIMGMGMLSLAHAFALMGWA